MINTLTIREGDIGRMRNGELTGRLRRHEADKSYWTDGVRIWRLNGSYLGHGDQSDLDIVAIVDPVVKAAPSNALKAALANGMIQDTFIGKTLGQPAKMATEFNIGDLITLEVCAVLKDGRPCVATVECQGNDGVVAVESIKGVVRRPRPIAVGDRVRHNDCAWRVIGIDDAWSWLRTDDGMRTSARVDVLTRLPDDAEHGGAPDAY